MNDFNREEERQKRNKRLTVERKKRKSGFYGEKFKEKSFKKFNRHSDDDPTQTEHFDWRRYT